MAWSGADSKRSASRSIARRSGLARATARAKWRPWARRPAGGLPTDDHVSRAWRIVFTLLFLILVGGVGYGVVTYTHLPLPPTRENIEIVATLEGHTKRGRRLGNAIPRFLSAARHVAVLEPTMTAKDLLKPLSDADLENGFCSASLAKQIRYEFPGFYENWPDDRLERVALEKYPEFQDRLCVLPESARREPGRRRDVPPARAHDRGVDDPVVANGTHHRRVRDGAAERVLPPARPETHHPRHCQVAPRPDETRRFAVGDPVAAVVSTKAEGGLHQGPTRALTRYGAQEAGHYVKRSLEQRLDGFRAVVAQRPRAGAGEVRVRDDRRGLRVERLPFVAGPSRPPVAILIEDVERLVAQLRELRAPAGPAAHRAVVVDRPDDVDLLTVVDLIPERLQHLPQRRPLGVTADASAVRRTAG